MMKKAITLATSQIVVTASVSYLVSHPNAENPAYIIAVLLAGLGVIVSCWIILKESAK